MANTVAGILLTGDHASRPAGNAVPNGSVYSCTTHSLIYQSNYAGNSWSTWASLTGSGMTDPMTTRGDMIIRNASNTTDRLGKGAANTVLTSDGTDLAWALRTRVLGGDIAADGSIVRGSGFTVTHGSAGHYTVNFTVAFTSIIGVSTVATTLVAYTAVVDGANPPTVNDLHVLTGIGGTSYNDEAFSFIAIGT